LLLRYGESRNGLMEKKAHIYLQKEHGIQPSGVDADALWVIKRIRSSGYAAYIVGGAVRDLLLDRTPKDFDIATDAPPQRLRRIFRTARMIGRRFRIVHVYMTRDKYIEVTTFRSDQGADADNLFGTIEEDARRRDFTINALYYCPVDQQILDYVGGYPDVRHRKLRTLVPAEVSFLEDPVRMIRAVKYASLAGFPLPFAMAGLIKKLREELLKCSRERVTEEVYKILVSGSSSAVLSLAYRLRMFEVLFPELARSIIDGRQKLAETPLWIRLEELDRATADGRPLPRDQMFGFLFRDLVSARPELANDPDPAFLAQQYIRTIAEPLFPSKRDLAVASRMILGEHKRPAKHPHVEHAARKEAGKGTGTGSGRRRRRRRRPRGGTGGAG
jgi:poly(A) polymerase